MTQQLHPARRTTRGLSGAVALTVVLALAACGGGGDGPTAEGDGFSVPASATASVSAFVRYLAGLAATDAAEPLRLDGANPPTTETEEPAALS